MERIELIQKITSNREISHTLSPTSGWEQREREARFCFKGWHQTTAGTRPFLLNWATFYSYKWSRFSKTIDLSLSHCMIMILPLMFHQLHRREQWIFLDRKCTFYNPRSLSLPDSEMIFPNVVFQPQSWTGHLLQNPMQITATKTCKVNKSY